MRQLDLTQYMDKLPIWFPYYNGSEFQKWDNLPDEIRSRLRPEHKFTTIFQGFRYTVKDYNGNGKWFVFRRNLQTLLSEIINIKRLTDKFVYGEEEDTPKPLSDNIPYVDFFTW